jgi:hypothetical protein
MVCVVGQTLYIPFVDKDLDYAVEDETKVYCLICSEYGESEAGKERPN